MENLDLSQEIMAIEGHIFALGYARDLAAEKAAMAVTEAVYHEVFVSRRISL